MKTCYQHLILICLFTLLPVLVYSQDYNGETPRFNPSTGDSVETYQVSRNILGRRLVYRSYHSDGTLRSKGRVRRGSRSKKGLWRYYNPKGDLISKEFYKRGRLVWRKAYFRNRS